MLLKQNAEHEFMFNKFKLILNALDKEFKT